MTCTRSVPFIATLLLGSAAADDDGLERCVVIDADIARLACYDALAGRPALEPAGTVVPVTPEIAADEPPPQTRPEPIEPLPTADPVPVETEQAVAEERPPVVDRRSATDAPRVRPEFGGTVARFERVGTGRRVRLTLENGEVWQETDGRRFRGTIAAGTEIVISERRFGGYQIRLPDRDTAILVKRIR